MLDRPAIVGVAYDRPETVRQLLASLSRAQIATSDVTLVISIDHSEREQEILLIAERFKWSFGKKRILLHREHLGLKQHIFKCAQLTAEFGAVILLEDDLSVSPVFYNYACQAVPFYAEDPAIAGVSLYSYQVHPYASRGECG